MPANKSQQGARESNVKGVYCLPLIAFENIPLSRGVLSWQWYNFPTPSILNQKSLDACSNAVWNCQMWRVATYVIIIRRGDDALKEWKRSLLKKENPWWLHHGFWQRIFGLFLSIEKLWDQTHWLISESDPKVCYSTYLGMWNKNNSGCGCNGVYTWMRDQQAPRLLTRWRDHSTIWIKRAGAGTYLNLKDAGAFWTTYCHLGTSHPSRKDSRR